MSNGIGDVISNLRKQANMRSEDLAAKAKVSNSTIYKIETGREPSSRILKKLAKALGVQASDILKLTEQKTKKAV